MTQQSHPNATDLDDEELSVEEDEVAAQSVPIEPYTIDDIIADGCFLERESIVKIITQLRHKKNIILQCPPGTGKTWLAKKLAYALMGQKDENSLRAVQFHPNLSYEDFVRGWRPSGEGKLTLVDGPFLEIINEAKKDASIKHVVVIEEINRGNSAQILGEMLTLLEADKRTPSEALELSYRRTEGERIHIPANLYVIGTMNIADRSLALVDLALRRRFAFFDLKPTFGDAWRNWVHNKAGIDNDFLQLIERRLVSLNNEISKDRNLGPQFKIGHSYVTPPLNTKIEDASAWFHGVVETEIGPLLEEYWFDDIEHAIKSKDAQVEDI
ncbi:AAA family ATPase [Vibrio parahaemolyticus]|uniref:AAA family ATPase n=1 Tax=Vibrio parahaemolyticus TaxID=670 RepID=UPI0027E4D344|nr:AAA family ATPase [Vibrio parahaemolyticus]